MFHVEQNKLKVRDHFLTQEEFTLEPTEIPEVWKTAPLPDDLAPYYESTEYISHHQDSGTVKEKVYKFFQSFNLLYKKNILLDFFDKGVTVLDYGCGAGEFLVQAEKDFSTIGCELNATARTAAQKKAVKTKFVSSLDEIADDSLDVITLWHVFEHIGNQQEMLELFQRKLKANGKLIIAVPNPTSYDARKYKEFWAAYDVPRHVFHFGKNGFKKLMSKNNWRVISERPLLLDAVYISILSEQYKKSTFAWLKGAVYGVISNCKAISDGQYSSLIYILEKK